MTMSGGDYEMSSTASLREIDPAKLKRLRSKLGPRFANQQQRKFFDSEAPELLYSGAYGAGKSRILCEKAYWLGKRYPGAPIGIFRKVAANLPATTKLTFFRDVCPPGAIVAQNKTENWYELSNGSRFWFLGLERDTETGMPSRVGSLDLAFAFVDEAVELTEGDWMMLAGRLRWPDVPFHQLAGATNPAGPKHWLKQRFAPDDAPRNPRREYLTATTFDNRLLPQDYVDRMADLTGIYRERYVKGEWIAVSGGMWEPDWIKHGTAPQAYREGVQSADLNRVVVAVDPAVTSGDDADETGIVVAGAHGAGDQQRGYVLADLSGRMHVDRWARRAVDAYHDFNADMIVGEVNNGGDLVGSVIHSVDPRVPFRSVVASRGKLTRAQPVASLYAQGRVIHTDVYHELESQMISYDGSGSSPDRMDALVWAVTDLMLGPLASVPDTDRSWIA